MEQQPSRNRQQTPSAGSEHRTERKSSYLRSGVVAGAASAVIFTLVHDLFISNIWDMLIIMMVAGAVCGLCLGWSYGRLFNPPSIGSWLGYNLVYLAMIGLLGATSVIVFDPVTTLAEVIENEGPIDELIRMALPMTVLYALATVAVIAALFARRRSEIGPIFLAVGVLVLFLGLNVSAIGLVDIPRNSTYLVAELFGLIVVIDAAFATTFLMLERKRLANPQNHRRSSTTQRQSPEHER